MTKILEETVGGFKVERIEREYRPTAADVGGIGSWVKLMGKQFFDVVEDKVEREKCEEEVIEVLKTVCESPGGGDWVSDFFFWSLGGREDEEIGANFGADWLCEIESYSAETIVEVLFFN